LNNKIFIGLVVLAAGVLAGWYFLKGGAPATTPEDKMTEESTPSGSNLGAPEGASEAGDAMEKGGVAERVIVTLSDKGFAPDPITVKVGTTVAFVNESGGAMWVASAPHPTHSLLPGFDQLASVARGGTYEYAFTKVGTWKYHNHVNASVTGSVVVGQ